MMIEYTQTDTRDDGDGMNGRRQRGMTLLEMLFAVALLGASMMAAAYFVSAATHTTKHNKDKDFATQKAISILEEMKSVVEINNGGQDVTLLDDYDDGITYSPVLTIETGITDPTHPTSGNSKGAHGWRFQRQISVQKFQSLQANDVRLVNVRILGNTDGKAHLLAETASVIRTIADEFPPTQVYDVYLLAMENVPGWWVYMSNLIPFVGNAVQDLQSRNPGLEIRTHWIRTLAYGRDREYTPYMNRDSASTVDIDWAYFYPATMPSGSAVNTYYVPTGMRAQINIDGTVQNGYNATSNPAPYALADHFNHAMRLEDERALFNTRVALGLEDPDSPTFRLLLEDMYTNPENFRNSIIINVHGELFPFPPFRNYSDAAKDPENRPGVRVVTHPEKLRFNNGEDLKMRVYAYKTDPSSGTDVLDTPISVFLPNIAPTATIDVAEIEGGVGGAAYQITNNDVVDDGGTDMWFEIEAFGGGTVLRLHRTPLITPEVASGQGLPTDKRLYGMEYIPAPLDADNSHDNRNLFSDLDQTKNTARWVITVDSADVPADARLTIDTRIGTDMTTGTLYPTRNLPTNLSRTYAWCGSDFWAFGDGTTTNPGNVPLTERFQMIGDPRHMPYADLKENYAAGSNPLGMGYNRYFDDFHNWEGNFANDTAYWDVGDGYQLKNDGSSGNDLWQGRVEIDGNRIFQTLRDSIIRSQSLWTTMTGFSYYYVGIGNEIGYDSANGFPSSIPVSSKPFDGSSGSRWEMSITNAQSGGVKYIRENDGSGWWGLNWVGELYPDAHYNQWRNDGNLASGSGDGTFVRVRRSDISTNLPRGTSLVNAMRRTQQEGSTSFFSVGSNTSKFHHDPITNNGSLEADGDEIAGGFNFSIPDQVLINRPFYFDRNGSGGVPDHYLNAAYTHGNTLTASEMAEFYNHPSGGLTGSALLGLDGGGSDMGYVVVNGIAQTIETGSAFMSRWSVLTMLQSFMIGGLHSGAERIVQVPRTEITEPNQITDLSSPASISVKWKTDWKRWDGQSYTNNYTNSFAETEPVDYVLMYSIDNGGTWRYMQNNLPAEPGEYPTGTTPTTTAFSYGWSTPSGSFPQGSYVIRVEAYRRSIPQHYAYHQRKIYIKR